MRQCVRRSSIYIHSWSASVVVAKRLPRYPCRQRVHHRGYIFGVEYNVVQSSLPPFLALLNTCVYARQGGFAGLCDPWPLLLNTAFIPLTPQKPRASNHFCTLSAWKPCRSRQLIARHSTWPGRPGTEQGDLPLFLYDP